MSDSEEDIVIIGSLLSDEEEMNRKNKIRKKCWVHNIYKKRLLHGEFHTLFPDLLDDEMKFFQYFRMSHQKFKVLLELVKPDIIRQNTTYRYAVGPEERLAICLRYLATGNSFRSLSFSFRMAERTIRQIIYSCCNAIWERLQPHVMPLPDEIMWKAIEELFYKKWNFPNLIGAIDGKHVVIQAPPNSGSQYFCYKKHFSVVLLALVDADYKFIAIDIGAYGKNSDGSIFANSNLGKRLNSNLLNVPPSKRLPGSDVTVPHVIIGDEAFPLRTYLMRPYPRDRLEGDEQKKVYNYRLSRARNVSENAFGILVKKFRVFENKLNVSPDHINSIVLATCCLHNFLRSDTCHWTEADSNVSLTDMRGLQNLNGIGGNAPQEALEIRDTFKGYFNSEVGSVQWQLRRVHEGRRFT